MLWNYAGDSDWFSNYTRACQHGQLRNCCWLCPAEQMEASDMPITDCRSNATCKDHLYIDGDTFGMSDQPLWRAKGVTHFHNAGDWMHAFAIGVGPRAVGSICQDLMLSDSYEGTLEERRLSLWQDVDSAYETLEIQNRCASLPLSMFYSTNNFPIFKGKASECMGLLEPLKHLCSAFCVETILQIFPLVVHHCFMPLQHNCFAKRFFLDSGVGPGALGDVRPSAFVQQLVDEESCV